MNANNKRADVNSSIWLACGVLGTALCITPKSFAQQPAAGTEPAGKVAADSSSSNSSASLVEIVVTGSRIALPPGATSPTPTTVLDSSTVQAMGLANIGDALNQLPAFLNNGEPTQSEALSPQNIGSRIVDLRGLGADRTLVLVDGRRFVPSTETGTVDLNLIPSILVSRTEIVTGGASAAYGSDAVAGVVNLILDHDLDGVKSQVQFGTSQKADNRDYQVSLAAGTDFMGGNAHVIAGFEYEKNSGMGDYYSRGWSRGEWCDVANSRPGVNGYAANNILPACHSATMTPGGLIIGGPLAGTQFSANGTPEPFHVGLLPGFLFMSGGDGYGVNPFFSGPQIEPEYDRASVYVHSDFNTKGDVQPFAELSYGSVRGSDVGAQYRGFPGNIILAADNPYIPPSVATAMKTDGLNALVLGRAFNDIGNSLGESDTSTLRVALGLKGPLWGGWKWDAYYQYGHNKYDQYEYDDVIPSKLALAVDAVVSPTGQIVCRSTLTSPGNGCQPLDLIGQHNYSQAARQYILGTSEQLNDNDQHVLAANVQGSAFDLPYGPLSVASGLEYRRDSLTGTTDPISAENGFYVFNGQDIDGAISVAEGYLEAEAPLLKDLPGVKSLALNMAGRETHYSTSGWVTTWKGGIVYEPNDTLRVRATRSRDIRAPNTFELFSPVNAGFTTVIDAKTGVETLPRYYSGGNNGLKPEVADTQTAGLVITPTWAYLKGFAFTVDYYDIKVHDVITQQGGQTILNNCEAGETGDCTLVTRGSNGNVTSINDVYQNLNELHAQGVDFELDYRHQLPGNAGEISFRGLATYARELTTVSNNGASYINEAGVDGVGGIPHYQANTFLTWTLEPLSITLQNRYVGGGKISPIYVGPQDPGYSPYLPNSINDNRIGSRFYTNLSASYDVIYTDKQKLQVYLVVNNLFDLDPPIDPGAASATNSQLFDPIGRYFTIGARLRL